MPPRLLMLKQPPCISSSAIFRARAFSESCESSTEICVMFFLSASRMTGTSNPRSVSTATPTLTYFFVTISPAARSIDALNCGNALSAAATILTAIAVKIVAAALKAFPQFNASIDLAAGEIVTKKYVNVGVAVDTARGLLVPVIRDADKKNITQISIELSQLSEKARGRKIALEEMQGGCFSISNLGGIGGTYFTPIVNAPEVAILGIARASVQPKFENGQFVPRTMLPLSLSYDHRAIDGADGIRFLRWVASAFEEPFVIALNG